MDLVAAGGIIVTLVVLEAVLSFDNAAILAVMSRRLPAGPDRGRALNYGLAIAYALRVLAILSAFLLIKFPLFLTVGGAYLVFLSGKHFWGVLRHREHAHRAKSGPAKGMLGLSPLATIVVQIGLVDLAFAMDQVIAAFGFTKEIWLIIIAATIGLVSLRVLAPFISRLMDWLPLLEHMAYVAVGFVGVLLVLEHPVLLPAPPHALTDLVDLVKIPVTLSLFAVPILVKLVFKVPRSHGHPHASDEKAIEAAQPLQVTKSPKAPPKPPKKKP
jgi:YkoY family integral membrane protein